MGWEKIIEVRLNQEEQKMFDEGLVSKTQLQQRNISYQNAQAKKIMVENKLAQTKQEVTNVRIEQNSGFQNSIAQISFPKSHDLGFSTTASR